MNPFTHATPMFLTLNIPPRHATAALNDLPRLFADTGATRLAWIVRARPETPPYLDQISRGMDGFDQGAKPFPLVMATLALQRNALPRDIETLSEA